ncbi:MAG: PQQ-binding-like beta-propeller repeat protein [Deltaproteobacteria bacterium]|nr:PQQ-binding-like beta-propeller repeat protein [Deltaproteobacteria bacterium]
MEGRQALGRLLRYYGSLLAVVAVPAASGCGGSTPPANTPTVTPSLTASATLTYTPTATATATATATPTASPTATEIAPVEWATYGQNQLRTFFNAAERRITKANVATMRPKWQYLTGAIITASPTVAYVDVPIEGRIKVSFVASWDGNFYALRADNGSKLWHYTMKPHPGGSFPYASSAEVTTVAGEQRVYVGGGMTVYCFAAATGELRWSFDAGTGCTTCDLHTERNEIETSPTVVGGLVYFAMDVNDAAPGKGGMYAVDANDGHLVWYFDVTTGATCRPWPTDVVYRFDGYHTQAELGLPEDFFATRPGCDFDRTGIACGNTWSSFAVDAARRLIFTATSNCDTDNDPGTPEPPPPMPPYDEALVALTFDGVPAWVWRPREVDNADLAFGGVPNLFAVELGGTTREVIGIGNKDGTYYLLDRDGMNELTGRIEPYWQTRVVEGGPIGGIIASAAVGDGKVFFSTAIGESLSRPQLPAAWALGWSDGALAWSNSAAPPSYAPTTAIPGVVFMGGLVSSLYAYDADTGEQLQAFSVNNQVASAATIVEGEFFTGAGVGARTGSHDSLAYQNSLIPSVVSAFCLPDAGDCPSALCNDGDPCTYDFHGVGGCQSEPAPDGLPCQADSQPGRCESGVCRAAATPTVTASATPIVTERSVQ